MERRSGFTALLIGCLDCFVRIAGEVMGGRNETRGGGEHIQHCFDSGNGDHGQREYVGRDEQYIQHACIWSFLQSIPLPRHLSAHCPLGSLHSPPASLAGQQHT